MQTHFRTRLHSKQKLVGAWMTIPSPQIAELFATSSDFDFVTVDLEHSSISVTAAENLIRTISLCRKPCMVRMGSHSPEEIKRVMDFGAAGIIVPMVNDAAAAKAVVNAVYYPPKGTRGVGLSRAHLYGDGFSDYLSWLNSSDGPTIIVQIEHRTAVENIEAILKTPGLNGIMVGPYDLSGSLNIPGQFDHPVYLDHLMTVRNAAKAAGIACGIHVISPDAAQANLRFSEGYDFLAYSFDIHMLATGMKTAKAIARKAASPL